MAGYKQFNLLHVFYNTIFHIKLHLSITTMNMVKLSCRGYMDYSHYSGLYNTCSYMWLQSITYGLGQSRLHLVTPGYTCSYTWLQSKYFDVCVDCDSLLYRLSLLVGPQRIVHIQSNQLCSYVFLESSMNNSL